MDFTVEGIIQLATSGGLGALAWYLIVRAIPSMQDKFDLTVEKMLNNFEGKAEADRQLYREAMSELIKALKDRSDG